MRTVERTAATFGPMSAVTPEDTRKLAHLSRLSLSEEEVERFAPQLQTILTYIEKLQSLDVSEVPEYLSSEQPDSSLRPDDVMHVVPEPLGMAWRTRAPKG